MKWRELNQSEIFNSAIQARAGFSIVETLVGFAIIGVLVLGFGSFVGFINRADQGTKQRGQLRELVTALRELTSQNGACVANLKGLTFTPSAASPTSITSMSYITKIGTTISLASPPLVSAGGSYGAAPGILINSSVASPLGLELVYKGTIGAVKPPILLAGITPPASPLPPASAQTMYVADFYVNAQRPGQTGAVNLADHFPIKLIVDSSGKIVDCFGDPIATSEYFMEEEICEITSNGLSFYDSGATPPVCVPKCYVGSEFTVSCPANTTLSYCSSVGGSSTDSVNQNYIVPPKSGIGVAQTFFAPVMSSVPSGNSCTCALLPSAAPVPLPSCQACCRDTNFTIPGNGP